MDAKLFSYILFIGVLKVNTFSDPSNVVRMLLTRPTSSLSASCKLWKSGVDYAATRARLGLKAIERNEVVDGLWFLV